MDEHGKKMIAPIVITILMVAYYIFSFGVLLSVIPLMAVKLLLLREDINGIPPIVPSYSTIDIFQGIIILMCV